VYLHRYIYIGKILYKSTYVELYNREGRRGMLEEQVYCRRRYRSREKQIRRLSLEDCLSRIVSRTREEENSSPFITIRIPNRTEAVIKGHENKTVIRTKQS